MLEMVAEQAARLSQITEAVLLATQLDRGTLSVETEPVDLGELARSTVETMKSHLPPTTDVDVDVAPDVGAATGARDRIQQVLVNLVDNAVKYGGDTPVHVRVEPANGIVRLVVADSGPGIPYAEQTRIFEKFYRAGPGAHSPVGRHGARPLHLPRARAAHGREAARSLRAGRRLCVRRRAAERRAGRGARA